MRNCGRIHTFPQLFFFNLTEPRFSALVVTRCVSCLEFRGIITCTPTTFTKTFAESPTKEITNMLCNWQCWHSKNEMRQRIDFCPRCCLGGFILFFAAPEEILAFENFSLTCCIFPCMVTFADVVFVFVSFAVVLLLSPCSKCKPVQYWLKTTSKQEQIPCAALQHDLKEMVRTRLPR